jgi:hypothetical protein
LPLGERSVLEVHQRAERGAREAVATNYKSRLIEAFVGDGSRFGQITFQPGVNTARHRGSLVALARSPRRAVPHDEWRCAYQDGLRTFLEFGVRETAELTVGTKVITTPFRFQQWVSTATGRLST